MARLADVWRLVRCLALGSVFASVALPSGILADEPPLVVYTVNYPLQYFAQRIARDHANVEFPAPADVDPAFWRPGADVIGAYQQADLILLNGAGYARWVEWASLPRRRLVNTSVEFKDRYIEAVQEVTHSHGPGGAHAHAGTAFITWLDLTQAVAQADAVRAALSHKRPAGSEQFDSNFRQLEAELLALDATLETLAATDPQKPLLASHPVYQYLARRYALNLESLLWEPDIAPLDDDWKTLQRLLEQHPAGWMIWENTPLDSTLTRLEALGVRSLVFSPCSQPPHEGDFMSRMRSNVENLRTAFQSSE